MCSDWSAWGDSPIDSAPDDYMVESFTFHPTLIVLFLKQIESYYKF